MKVKLKYLIFIIGTLSLLSKNIGAEMLKDFEPQYSTNAQPSSQTIYDETVYSKCILDFSKEKQITSDVRSACKVLATPKICRNVIGTEYLKCLNTCEKSNIYTREFGDCRLK